MLTTTHNGVLYVYIAQTTTQPRDKRSQTVTGGCSCTEYEPGASKMMLRCCTLPPLLAQVPQTNEVSSSCSGPRGSHEVIPVLQEAVVELWQAEGTPLDCRMPLSLIELRAPCPFGRPISAFAQKTRRRVRPIRNGSSQAQLQRPLREQPHTCRKLSSPPLARAGGGLNRTHLS